MLKNSGAFLSQLQSLFFPFAVPLDAHHLIIFFLIPDKFLLDNLAGLVENLPVILKSHKVLLFSTLGTVHILGLRQMKGKKTTSDEFLLPVISMSSSSLMLKALSSDVTHSPNAIGEAFVQCLNLCHKVMWIPIFKAFLLGVLILPNTIFQSLISDFTIKPSGLYLFKL